MRGSKSLLLVSALSLLSATSQAIELVKKSNPAVVGFPIERKHVPNPVERDNARTRRKRDNSDNTVTQELDNEKTLYFCNITIGTPSQKLRTHIDTGSSDLWVNSPSSGICRSRGHPCRVGGTFDEKKSSSYNVVSKDFNISYVDGTYALGSYVTDKFGIGDITLDDFQFGLGTKSTTPQGVLGIGYPINEVQSTRNHKKPYPNLPKALTDEGHIQSMAYSMWLNDLGASTGQIMFGGVNSGKYHGSLTVLPVLSRRGVNAELAVSMTGLSITTGDDGTRNISSRSFPVSALLDSGSSLSYLPKRVVDDIFEITSATYDSNAGAGFVACDMASSSATFQFYFSGITIIVDMTELVVDPGSASDGGGGRPSFSDGTPACFLGIAPTSGGTPILGDTFLRSAYVVYDLANDEISIAKTNFNSTEDDIHEIGTGKDSVPDVTGVSSPATSAGAGTNGVATAGPSATGESAAASLRSDIVLTVVGCLASAWMLFAVM